MKFVLVLLVLAALSYFAFVHRERIKAFLPGMKTYAWNALIAVAGIAAPVLDYLGKVDLSTILTKENAALAAIAVGVVGILLSMVTKRAGDA